MTHFTVGSCHFGEKSWAPNITWPMPRFPIKASCWSCFSIGGQNQTDADGSNDQFDPKSKIGKASRVSGRRRRRLQTHRPATLHRHPPPPVQCRPWRGRRLRRQVSQSISCRPPWRAWTSVKPVLWITLMPTTERVIPPLECKKELGHYWTKLTPLLGVWDTAKFGFVAFFKFTIFLISVE